MSTELTDDDVLERSTYLTSLKRKRLAPSRLAELLKAAKGSKPPSEPPLGECCGSSCKPCVNELWRQEMRCWNEVHPDGVESDEEAEEEAAGPSGEEPQPKDKGSPTIEIKLELRKEDVEAESGSEKAVKAGSVWPLDK